MALVYQHIRNDLNQVFYIGIGAGVTRAHSKKNRNLRWQEVVSLTSYRVEILFDGLSKEACMDKERELIALHGRECDGGILVNMLDNGMGAMHQAERLGTEQESQVLAFWQAYGRTIRLAELAAVTRLWHVNLLRKFFNGECFLSSVALARVHAAFRAQAQAMQVFLPAPQKIAAATARRNTLRTYLSSAKAGRRGTPELVAKWTAELQGIENTLF